MSSRDHGGIATPIGYVSVTIHNETIAAIRISVDPVPRGTSSFWRQASEQIEQWLAGERRDFDLPLAPAQTPRGEALRGAMIELAYGSVTTYGALAKKIASSPRAIGQACARNPLPIIVPCHRVLSAGERLGFYSAGSGPATKAWLLSHERAFAGDPA